MFCEMQVMVFFDTLSLKKAEKICINQTLDGFREGLKMPDRSIDPVSKFSLICDLLKKIGLLILRLLRVVRRRDASHPKSKR